MGIAILSLGIMGWRLDLVCLYRRRRWLYRIWNRLLLYWSSSWFSLSINSSIWRICHKLSYTCCRWRDCSFLL